MRYLAKALVTTSTAAAIGLFALRARAQASDITPQLPNVLLLVDSSGSMEKTVAGNEPDCTPLTPPSSEVAKSRWTKLVESLTGPIQDFSCWAQPRTSTGFVNEFRLGTADPYDKDYYIPFHRLLSAGCTKGPGPTADSLSSHLYSNPSQPCTTPWTQVETGLLDVYKDRIRFALMTFDTLPDASTGLVGALPDSSGGMEGMWSYFPGFQTGGSPAQGNPPGCTLSDVEVGARNPAAPLWEGPLVPFNDYTAPLTDVQVTNERIQNALIAMRPYGATPLAGMLADARTYLLDDGSTWNGLPIGPRDDPYVSGGCRTTAIVLISDGEPNQDLRPECAAGPGPSVANDGCPYEQTYDIAGALYQASNPNKRVKVFTVGFGLSAQAGIDCKTLVPTDFQAGGLCDNATGPIRACCNLGQIAMRGGTEHGYFPNDGNELTTVIAHIFAEIDNHSTSRTLPVFASATATTNTGSNADAVAYQFATSFTLPPDGSLWKGNLERKRFACESVNGTLTAVQKDVDQTLGDDFSANVNSNDVLHPRKFFSIIGELDTTAQRIHSTYTIRPAAASSDGLSSYTGTMTGGGSPTYAANFASELGATSRALNFDPTVPTVDTKCTTELASNTASVCAERLISWEIGEPMPAGVASRDRNELGSIYHATPVVVGPPNDLLQDESYQLFATQQANRPLVLYTATTDGQLHAFKVTAATAADALKVDRIENNEIWSFLPPHVLPRLLTSFNREAVLLDGAPVVQNVVFERTAAQAEAAGTAGGASWRTVLLASGGSTGDGFYYALDITNPQEPQFLWQLSTDGAGTPLFGTSTPAPALGMVAIESGGQIKQVSVAILAGGAAALDTGAPSCPRKNTTTPIFAPTSSTLALRSSVRCWGTAATDGLVGPARSLTIVRLDTGEVLRTFRGDLTGGPPGIASKTTIVDFDSPITGVPIPFPSQVGQVADRIYIGDADGTLWRVNLSSPNPANWAVDLAWDAYSRPGDTAATSHPIQTTPIVSIDPLGNKVILLSTGDQETFTSAATLQTRVWSLIEKPFNGSYHISENWMVPFTGGSRVTGPISLFNGCAYFATFTPTPPGAYACSNGYGSIWGVDYLSGDPDTDAPYPKACLIPTPGAAAVHSQDQPAGTVVFGVAVTQKPSCVATETFNDPYFGSQTVIREASSADYQLVFHTGAAGDQDAQGSQTRTSAKTLLPPRVVVRVDSWASVVE